MKKTSSKKSGVPTRISSSNRHFESRDSRLNQRSSKTSLSPDMKNPSLAKPDQHVHASSAKFRTGIIHGDRGAFSRTLISKKVSKSGSSASLKYAGTKSNKIVRSNTSQDNYQRENSKLSTLKNSRESSANSFRDIYNGTPEGNYEDRIEVAGGIHASKSEAHLQIDASSSLVRNKKKSFKQKSQTPRGASHTININNFIVNSSKTKASTKLKSATFDKRKSQTASGTPRSNSFKGVRPTSSSSSTRRSSSTRSTKKTSPARVGPSPIDIGIPSIVSRFSYSSQTGFIPLKAKVNQDVYVIVPNFNNIINQWFFACCDGHGVNGHFVSDFVKQRLPVNIEIAEKLYLKYNRGQDSAAPMEPGNDFKSKALVDGMLRTNEELINQSFDTNFSGTTVVSVMLLGNKLWCSNVGDSRAVLARKTEESWHSIPLSRDHKPDDILEKQRIYECDGRVEPFREANGDPIGPHRVWLKNENAPGLAMSRSLGDQVAARVGVIPEPEILNFELTHEDKFIVLASDGVWEFLKNEDVISMIIPFWEQDDPEGACERVIRAATQRWREEDEIVDDITMVVVFLDSNIFGQQF
eukprot:CAMPEP_0115046528 /NCGR_PEP_ID=MMETSP0216-20121206/48797_1 /TAXON_ID=223996 /ORGANISM="Protocruzia adherens, Strain Boccale" /LENGTH=581 /DNA_ID=CAMNT_0002429615 /DNA_START=83 /DNA_END=1828 /DNA_ORIENTATION=+